MTDPFQHLNLIKCNYDFPYHSDDYKPEYGVGTLFYVPCIRGKSKIDRLAFLEYLETTELKSASRHNNGADIRYQDMLLPHDPKTAVPYNELARQLATEICEAATQLTHMPAYMEGPMWSIKHTYMEQTYPHGHFPGREIIKEVPLAAVYWVSVPEGSGPLEIYPTDRIDLTRYVMPVEGDFLIFPAEVLHGVRHNTNKTEPRISVSMNLTSTERQIAGLEVIA